MATGTQFLDSYHTFIQTKVGASVTRALGSSELDELIQDAVDLYSHHKPNYQVVDITGNGTNTYNLATVLTEFEVEWSYLTTVEYPEGEQPPNIIKDSEWQVYEAPTQTQLLFNAIEPTSSETIRVTVASRHTLTSTSSTITDGDYRAVATLAASYVASALAAHYAGDRDLPRSSSLQASQERAEFFQELSDKLYNQYKRRMGIPDDEKQKPVTTTFDIDTFGQHGTGYITHPRR